MKCSIGTIVRILFMFVIMLLFPVSSSGQIPRVVKSVVKSISKKEGAAIAAWQVHNSLSSEGNSVNPNRTQNLSKSGVEMLQQSLRQHALRARRLDSVAALAESRINTSIVALPSPPDSQRKRTNTNKAMMVTKEDMLTRFLKYVKIDSQSQEADVAGEFPMTDGQIVMAKFLEDEAKALGADVYRSEDAYVYITIPSNTNDKVPTLGISCHLDFTPEAPGGNINPIVKRNYQGGDILLGNGKYLRVDSPEGADLKNLIGKTIIHTDGATLLGGDDKNGCAIAMSLVESLLRAGRKSKHGIIQVVFCPNEDVGLSAERIDTTRFNPDILFDLDGEGSSEVLAENFTARSLVLKFVGRYAHPGSAKEQKLGDALAAASSFIAAIPLKYRPENTEGREGYIHPWKMAADGNDYIVHSRIRYFDKEEGAEFKRILADNIESIKRNFSNVKVETVQDILQYENVAYNMHPESRNIVEQAAKKVGVEVNFVDVRGGTTASMFTAKGLRGGMCLFTGQHAIHSVHEYSVLEEMYDSYKMMLHVIGLVAGLEE